MQKNKSGSNIPIDGLPNEKDIRFVVWWYCGIKKNNPAPSEPIVEVCFRRVLTNGNFGSYLYNDIGITHLGQVRLGSIWKNQQRDGEISLDTEIFQLDFSDGGWCFASPWKYSKDTNDPGWLVSLNYRLREKERYSKTQVVQFHLTENPRGLVIPCLEMFTRLYGRSQYIKRILLNESFINAYDNLIVPDVEKAPPNTWQVTVDKHCVNGDALFLAHLKHDSITQKRVRLIWSKSEVDQGVTGNLPAFPKIGPWFSGPAHLKVRGIWLDAKKHRFLALQIEGVSDPGGVDIYFDRANTNLTGTLEKIKSGSTWHGVRKVDPKSLADIQITHIQEPSGAYTAEEIFDDPLSTLGWPRKISRLTRESTGIREKPSPAKISPANKLSGGANYGSEKGVAPAAISAPETTDVDETMIEVWKALKEMSKAGNSDVIEVASLSADGSQNVGAPNLIALPNPETTPGLPSDSIPWLYLDHTTKKNIRGVMLLKVSTKKGVGYLLEIQKRPPHTTDGSSQTPGGFQGLAFKSNGKTMFKQWINNFIKEIAIHRGVVSKVTSSCPGNSYTFNHVSEKYGGIPKSVINGLTGIGLL